MSSFDLAPDAVVRIASLREPRTTIGAYETLFAGFSHARAPSRTMLVSTLGAAGGPPDKLPAVTRPLTGAYYVIPSADRLAAFDREISADA